MSAPRQSFALPENWISSPTVNCAPAAGVTICAVGGAPAVTVTLVVPCRPPGSVTRSRTVTAPAAPYVRVGRAAVESS